MKFIRKSAAWLLALLLLAAISGCGSGSKEVRMDELQAPDRSAMTPEQSEQARRVLEQLGQTGVAPPGTPGAAPLPAPPAPAQ